MNDPTVLVFSLLVVLVVVAHLAYIGYLVTGGFLAWSCPRSLWLHIPVVVWGLVGLALNLPCPLTAVERWARSGAGMASLPREGFIAHYIAGVWFPDRAAAGIVEMAPPVVVSRSWAVAAARGWRGGSDRLVPHRGGTR
jgi:hypothetical protein